MFSGLLRTLMPVAKTAVKTVGKIAKNKGVRSVGRYLKNEAKKAAVDTALEALEGRPVGAAAKKRLKTATRSILQRTREPDSAAPYARRQTTKRKTVRLETAKFKRRKTRVGRQEPLFYDDDGEYDDY